MSKKRIEYLYCLLNIKNKKNIGDNIHISIRNDVARNVKTAVKKRYINAESILVSKYFRKK